jgi:hypothetical protein
MPAFQRVFRFLPFAVLMAAGVTAIARTSVLSSRVRASNGLISDCATDDRKPLSLLLSLRGGAAKQPSKKKKSSATASSTVNPKSSSSETKKKKKKKKSKTSSETSTSSSDSQEVTPDATTSTAKKVIADALHEKDAAEALGDAIR